MTERKGAGVSIMETPGGSSHDSNVVGQTGLSSASLCDDCRMRRRFHHSDAGRWDAAQTYIDSMGNRLVLIGSFDGGRMLLNAGATRSFWQPVDRNTVRFVQEQSRDGGQTWTPFFDSRYTRR